MDGTYVYYAQHREPVMGECVDLIQGCGGIVKHAEWNDCDVAPGWPATLWHCLRHARHGKAHRIVHQLVPSMRAYIIIRVVLDSAHAPLGDKTPPLFKNRGVSGKGRRRSREAIFSTILICATGPFCLPTRAVQLVLLSSGFAGLDQTIPIR